MIIFIFQIKCQLLIKSLNKLLKQISNKHKPTLISLFTLHGRRGLVHSKVFIKHFWPVKAPA